MLIRIPALALTVLAGCLSASSAGVDDGAEGLVIVSPANPQPEETQAVELLVQTLEQLYPGRIETVSVGETPEAGARLFVGTTGPDGEQICDGDELDPDGFLLIRYRPWRSRVGPRRYPYRPLRHRPGEAAAWLAIAGASPRGTYYGAAWLLREHYGVLWLFPGEDGVSLPEETPSLLPRVGGRVEPSFEERSLSQARKTPEQKEWTLRNGLGSRFYYNHNLHRLTDAEAFKDHPAWQSTLWGRKTERVTSNGPQPNLLDPGYQAHIAEQAARYFDEHPDEQSVSLGITDSLSFDQSAHTRAAVEPFTYFRGLPNYSEAVFGFTNAVAVQLFEDEATGDKYADKVLTQLAYYYAEEVPELELHPQIMPWLTSDRAQWFDHGYRAGDEALIRRWERTGVNKLGSWDYYEGIPYFIPRHYPTIIGESLPYLYAHGVRSFFAEGVRNPGIDDPKLWLAAQLLWDIEKDPDVLLEEYFRRCYRESAAPMRRFYALCEEAWMKQPPPGRWIKYFTSPSQAELFPLELCARLRACLEEARSLAPDELVRRRIGRVSDSFRMTELAVEHYWTWRRLAAQPRASSADAEELLATEPELSRALTGNWRRSLALFFLLRSDPTHRGEPLPEGSKVMVSETFTEPLFSGGLAAAPAQPGLTLEAVGEGGWELDAQHTEKMRLEQSPRAARGTGNGLRIEGNDYFGLIRTVAVQPGQQLYLRAWCRGRLSGDAQVYVNMRLLDADGKSLGSWHMDGLPPGEHDWLPLTAVGEAMTGAAKARLELVVRNQGAGDWIDWDDIELYIAPGPR